MRYNLQEGGALADLVTRFGKGILILYPPNAGPDAWVISLPFFYPDAGHSRADRTTAASEIVPAAARRIALDIMTRTLPGLKRLCLGLVSGRAGLDACWIQPGLSPALAVEPQVPLRTALRY